MRSQSKPDFSSVRGGWIDSEFIPLSVQRELMLHLKPSPLTDEQKHQLLQFSNEIGQMVTADELASGKKQREQLETVAANAHRLLSSLRLLSQPARDAFHSNLGHLAYSSAAPIELDQRIKDIRKQPGGNLLSATWDLVAALETVSNYTAAQFCIDTTSKPGQQRARGFVAMLAEHIRVLTGTPPPKDPAAWFAPFAACLGEQLGFKEIGPRIIKSGIESLP